MNMANAVVLGILILAVGGAVYYMIKAKKNGVKCIGCSCGGCSCEKDKDHAGCSCSCQSMTKG